MFEKEKLSYTTAEAVKALGIRRQNLYMYRDCGLLNPSKTGRTYIWLKDDLLNFLHWAQGLDLSNPQMIHLAKIKKPFTPLKSNGT